eukprot:XP_001690429.1 predicted protein [Chlamydomonas reinhardtii]
MHPGQSQRSEGPVPGGMGGAVSSKVEASAGAGGGGPTEEGASSQGLLRVGVVCKQPKFDLGSLSQPADTSSTGSLRKGGGGGAVPPRRRRRGPPPCSAAVSDSNTSFGNGGLIGGGSGGGGGDAFPVTATAAMSVTAFAAAASGAAAAPYRNIDNGSFGTGGRLVTRQ